MAACRRGRRGAGCAARAGAVRLPAARPVGQAGVPPAKPGGAREPDQAQRQGGRRGGLRLRQRNRLRPPGAKLRRRAAGRPSGRRPPQDAAAELRRVRRGSLLRAGDRQHAGGNSRHKSGHHHLRGHLERRGVPARPPLRPPSRRGTRRRRRGATAQPLRLAVEPRQGAQPARAALTTLGQVWLSGGVLQPRRRERRAGVRRRQPILQRPRRARGQRRDVRRGFAAH